MTNKQVAYALSISEQTVKNHMSSHPAEALRQRPDPGRGVRDAPGLDPDAGGLRRAPTGEASRDDHVCRSAARVLDPACRRARRRHRRARSRAHRDRHARGPGAHRGRASRAEARPGRRAAVLRRGQATATDVPRATAARHADQARRADGGAGRRPRGQAPRARPPPRRASRRSRTRWTRMPATGLSPEGAAAGADAASASLSRVVLSAQEDLRREIARAMHDGPAQSLTNIVLQAADRRADDRQRPGAGEGRDPAARGDGPADPRRDQELHLRRAPDGARRPGLVPDPPARDARPRPARQDPGGVRLAGRRTGGCRWTSRARSSGSSTRRWRPTSR